MMPVGHQSNPSMTKSLDHPVQTHAPPHKLPTTLKDAEHLTPTDQKVLYCSAACGGAIQLSAGVQTLELPLAGATHKFTLPSHALVTRPDLRLWRCQLCLSPRLPA
jgi:hypothetical protein